MRISIPRRRPRATAVDARAKRALLRNGILEDTDGPL
jgi:hypothetical protein